MSRTFSNKYVSIQAEIKHPVDMNCISINFPNRDELSLRTVRALPKVSRMGLDCNTCDSNESSSIEHHDFWNMSLSIAI